jgi:hypothetical protein
LKNFLLTAVGCAFLSLSSQSSAGLLDWIQNQLSKAAVDYGYWTCAQCSIPPVGQAVPPEFAAQAVAYIKANNGYIHEGERVARWIPNSTISLCRDGTCITVIY